MATMTYEDLIETLGDDARILQLATTRLLLFMATGTVDATQMARHELAQRGVGADGEWIGFPAAATLWAAPATPPGAGEVIIDPGLEVLAQVHLNIETLAERRMDALDFHEVAVWQVQDALRAAFERGRASQ